MVVTGCLTIGEVAARLHVSVTFLRRLDTLGVVEPWRSHGGHRRYGEAHIQEVRRVLVLLDAGFPLPTVPRVLMLESELVRLRRERDVARQERDEALQLLAERREAPGLDDRSEPAPA
jgi:DNA-binding transcriptional MerR regulator